jgi:hypothetical protein
VSPVQVGNGEFAFGMDITGLQTFVPFATMSNWGWKVDPIPDGEDPEVFSGQTWETHGRHVKYRIPNHQEKLCQWLISNPNRLNLGRIGLWFDDSDINEESISNCDQVLDLWTGVAQSKFTLKDKAVEVTTSCHPSYDSIGISLKSPLLKNGSLSLFIDFPFCDGREKFSAPYVGYWDETENHRTTLVKPLVIQHCIGGTEYYAHANIAHGALKRLRDHRYKIEVAQDITTLDISFTFNRTDTITVPSASDVHLASRAHWVQFWSKCGIIDMSQNNDPRCMELERRTILSQYVMAVNASGWIPPQESGLVNNGWYGKFHFEMIWWHSAYLAVFNQWQMLDRLLSVYFVTLNSAKNLAKEQGYSGARWPKMTDPSGSPTPGEINSLLIWQQPHPIIFAELDYRAHPQRETLTKWKDVVFQTAEFMADFAYFDEITKRYNLGPPIHVMSENTTAKKTLNPAFELEYWSYGLKLAIKWLRTAGEPVPEKWKEVVAALAPVPRKDGLFVMSQGIEDMWTNYNWEHPSLLGLYGQLLGTTIEKDVYLTTCQKIWERWQFDRCWGWDFGMAAMNAARLGYTEKAIDFLLHESMPFDDVGLAPGGDKVPFPYLPCNGSLLLAVGMMAAGWDGINGQAPGFPQNWLIRSEGLKRYI